MKANKDEFNTRQSNGGDHSNTLFKTLSAPGIRIIERKDDDAAYSHRCSARQGITLSYENIEARDDQPTGNDFP